MLNDIIETKDIINKKTVILSETPVTIEMISTVANENAIIEMSSDTIKRIENGRKLIEQIIIAGKPVYGVNTGLGDNYRIAVSPDDSRAMQHRFIESHACGVGRPLSRESVRAVIFAMIVNFSHGHSGVRLLIVEKLIELLNKDITPYVPEDGSVGYLSYQAHISLVLIGSGKVLTEKGEMIAATEIYQQKDFHPVTLYEKEGLSLLNGSVDMTALAALAVNKAQNLLKHADLIAMMSFQALNGNTQAFEEQIGRLKPQPGLKTTLDNINTLNAGYSADKTKKPLQDALSLRAIPQVHGASRDALSHVREIVEIELNSSTDNPMVIEKEGKPYVFSSANPHGQSIALAMDYLAIAISELANISERRTYRLNNPHLSQLPAFLVENPGINTGFMITQYVSSDLVAKNKVLAHPASVDSIPNSAAQEDHVSMGNHAAQKALQIIKNSQSVLAIEWLTAAQGMEFGDNTLFSYAMKKIHALLRAEIPRLSNDRQMYHDIHLTIDLIEKKCAITALERNGISLM
ncbi:MAG: HAL/PAL/TAL family ammonia-lyase [Francisellaceae bacterium]